MKKAFQLFLSFTLFLLINSSLFAQSQFGQALADSAYTLTHQHVIYDPSYFSIKYPNGDVPAGKGVCTDVVIRAYRKLGIDLQKNVHEDMKANFGKYPNNWGLTRPDKNIDHQLSISATQGVFLFLLRQCAQWIKL